MKVVIASIIENGSLRGFATIDSNTGFVAVPLSDVNHYTYFNAKYDFQYKTLVGTMGSLTDYPQMDTHGVLLGKNGIIVVEEDGSLYRCYDGKGRKLTLTFADLKKAPIQANYKIDGTKVLSKGQDFIRKQRKPSSPPLEEVMMGKVGKGDQVVMVLANMKRFTPYYHLILQSLRKKSIQGFGTCAVTEDTLIYDDDFMKKMTLGEMTFIFIHESLHVVMQHSLRARNRNHELWNIACDLYINSVIIQNFGLVYGGDELRRGGTREKPGVLKIPEQGVFMETTGMSIDLDRDTPETIYAQLCKENPNYQNKQQIGNGKPQDGNGNVSGQGNQQSDGQDGQEGKDGQEDKGDGKQKQDGQIGQGQTGQGQGSNGQQGQEGQDSDGHGSGKPSSNQDSTSSGKGGSSNEPQVKEITVTYNGKQIKGKVIMDIKTNNATQSPEVQRANLERSKQVLQNVKTNIMKAQQDGCSVDICSSVQREIEFGLATGVNWKVLLRNACKTNPKKMFTLGNPNRDYMNMGLTVAGRSKIGKPKDVSDIVIGVDVSGSVSKQKLDYFLSSVAGIFQYYNASGKLIYWSTEVGGCGDFKEMKDLLKVKPTSTGGTDVSCLFKYLYTHKIKAKILIIITDGCFYKNYSEYAKLYGRQTIWLIDGNARSFEPAFGKVVALEEENN